MSNKSKVRAATIAAVIALASPLFMHFEGNRAAPYKDVGGVPTVCYGHTGDVQDRAYSRAECDTLMGRDLLDANAAVARCIGTDAPLSVEAALTDAAANIGPKVVCGSTLQRKAAAHDWKGVCDELPRWNKADGNVLAGLTARRESERQLCMRDVR